MFGFVALLCFVVTEHQLVFWTLSLAVPTGIRYSLSELASWPHVQQRIDSCNAKCAL